MRKPLKTALWALTAAIVLCLATCGQTPKGLDGLYRTTAAEICDDIIFLSTNEFEPSLVTLSDGRVLNDEARRKCPVQSHAVVQNAPSTEAALAEVPEARFNLAFYEILEGDDPKLRSREEERLAKIKLALQSNERNYIIVYVHGWRHNAKVNNNNVRKFRTLLNYTRSFMNDRPQYRDVVLTGIYVGWRGQSVLEPSNQSIDDTTEDCGALCFSRVALSFLGRHEQSKKIAQNLREMVRSLQDVRTNKPRDASADKLLVVGHSLGGNVIAEAIKEPMIELIKNHTPGEVMLPPLGDLAVIINAASEASNWNDLQRELRREVYPDDENVDLYLRSGATEIETFFPTDQRPTYLAITSACSWGDADKVEDAACDLATSTIFPLAQIVRFRLSDERRLALGHYEPDYTPDGGGGWISVERHALGQSHDMITNLSPMKFETRFSNGSLSTHSRCDPSDGWLYAARQRSKVVSNPSGRSWDSDYPPGTNRPNPLLYTSEVTGTRVQMRHTLGLAGANRVAPSPMPANVPFWNVRASPNVIDGHSSFVNYQAWCAINQLVLDDVASAH